jgi:hypothetical protein
MDMLEAPHTGDASYKNDEGSGEIWNLKKQRL